MVESKRITLVNKEDIQIDLEYTEMYAILHLPRMKMNKSSYLDFMITVKDIHQFVTYLGYEAIWTAIDPKDKTTAKLLDRLGAKQLGQSEGMNVYEYRGVN